MDLAAWSTDWRMVESLGGGNRNEVALVEIDGIRRVARRSARSAGALDWEVDVVRRTGLGPDLVPTTDGRCHHAGTVVMALVDGHPPEDDEWVLVGETLERLHESTVGWPQRPGFRSSVDLLVEDRGGDVDLTAMPAPAVARCRTAWRQVHGVPTVVHGDPGRENVRIVGGRAILLDWDEARVDLPAFDLAVLPGADEATVQAAHAWEAATCWQAEPEYARRRLAQLR